METCEPHPAYIFILIPTNFKERITPTKLYNAARVHKIIFSFIIVVYSAFLPRTPGSGSP